MVIKKVYIHERNKRITNAGCIFTLFGLITISHLHAVIASDGTIYPDYLEGVLAPFTASKMAKCLKDAINEEENLRNEPRRLVWNSQDTALSIN